MVGYPGILKGHSSRPDSQFSNACPFTLVDLTPKRVPSRRWSLSEIHAHVQLLKFVTSSFLPASAEVSASSDTSIVEVSIFQTQHRCLVVTGRDHPLLATGWSGLIRTAGKSAMYFTPSRKASRPRRFAVGERRGAALFNDDHDSQFKSGWDQKSCPSTRPLRFS